MFLHRSILAAFLVLASLGLPAAEAVVDGPATRSLERNRRNVLAFYDLAFNQSRPREAMEKYAGATYTQHNPEVADGKEGFIAYFEQLAKDFPGKRLVVKRSIAEGDHVVVHCEHTFPGFIRGGTWAGIDIFRLDAEGRIVEHWDVLQKVPSSMAHGNGMF